MVIAVGYEIFTFQWALRLEQLNLKGRKRDQVGFELVSGDLRANSAAVGTMSGFKRRKKKWFGHLHWAVPCMALVFTLYGFQIVFCYIVEIYFHIITGFAHALKSFSLHNASSCPNFGWSKGLEPMTYREDTQMLLSLWDKVHLLIRCSRVSLRN